MKFVYFSCEFYRISNAIAYETLILNYNETYAYFFYFFFFKFTYLGYDFSNIILYIYIYIYLIFKMLLFDPTVQLMIHWLN